MFHFKSISETLAALSTGAVLLGACAGSQAPVNSGEVPAAEMATPAQDTKPTTEGATEEAAAGTTDNAAASPAEATPTPAGASPSATPTASAAAAPKAKPKAAGKAKPKGGAAGSCGEGTCG